MYILNHSCSVATASMHSLIDWLKQYVDNARMSDPNIEQYQLSKMVSHVDEAGSELVILQVYVRDVVIEEFLPNWQSDFLFHLKTSFDEKALCFISVMELIK